MGIGVDNDGEQRRGNICRVRLTGFILRTLTACAYLVTVSHGVLSHPRHSSLESISNEICRWSGIWRSGEGRGRGRYLDICIVRYYDS